MLTAARRLPEDSGAAARGRRAMAEFAAAWRQFWQGYWRSPHSC